MAVSGSDTGGLLFVIGPVMMLLLLRFWGGDGWKDAGLGLRLKASWQWYLFALLAYPVTIILVIMFGVKMGITKLHGDLGTALSVVMGGIVVQLVPRMIFALFEEADKVVDYSELFNVKGQIISEILCRNSVITIRLRSKDQIVLRLTEPASDDSNSELVFIHNEA